MGTQEDEVRIDLFCQSCMNLGQGLSCCYEGSREPGVFHTLKEPQCYQGAQI